MTKEEDFKLLKIQTFILKVNIDCDGCKQKVKKLLRRIEGVYQVSIDAEQHKVTVSGNVEYVTLIKKLDRVGKHAELWSQKSVQNQNQNQNQNQKSNCVKDHNNKNMGDKQGVIKGLEAFKNQQKFPFLISEEDEDCFDDEDGEEFDEEDELRLMTERANQLGLLRQQQSSAINGMNMKRTGTPNHGKMAGNGNNRKGTPNQNFGIKANPRGELDPKAMAALKMNNAQFGGGNLEGKSLNDLNALMSLSQLQGNVSNMNPPSAAFGGNSNGGLNGFPGSFSTSGIPNTEYSNGQYPPQILMNMNGHNHNHNHPSSMMNMQNRNNLMQHQQQLMYQRSPYMPPSTGYYYYNCYTHPSPYTSYNNYTEQPSYESTLPSSTTHDHEFSDETSVGCSIM